LQGTTLHYINEQLNTASTLFGLKMKFKYSDSEVDDLSPTMGSHYDLTGFAGVALHF
jgi:hypothetical protein